MYILYAALISALLSSLFIPLIVLYATRRGLFDKSNERKIHSGDIPRLGGFGIFLSTVITVIILYIVLLRRGVFDQSYLPYLSVIISIALIHLTGLVDDLKNLRAMVKFTVQLVCAVAVAAFGFRFRHMPLPFTDTVLDLGWVGYPLTVLWIVGITNAVNLIDGLDGLAGGIGFIAAASFGIIHFFNGNYMPALLAFSLVGAIAGFLFYNFPPAKIFMGDSGSYLLGFSLAVLPLMNGGGGGVQTGLFIAITILLIPVYDTITAITRRVSKRVSFFSPDKDHIHHKFMHTGFSSRQILGVVYPLSLLLGVLAVGSLYVPRRSGFFLVAACWVVVTFVFTGLHYANKNKIQIVKNEDSDIH